MCSPLRWAKALTENLPDAKWRAESAGWGAPLITKAAADELVVSLDLPLRGKSVLVRPSDTHHCNGAPSSSRTLDLTNASEDLMISIAIHNGLHCQRLATVPGLIAESSPEETTSFRNITLNPFF